MRKYLDIIEAFSDLGKSTPEELAKGQKLNPADSDNFRQVPGRVFFNVVSTIRKYDQNRVNGKGLDTLSVYSVPEYKNMRCFLGKNNSSGYCLKGSEIVSLFSSQASSGVALISDAVSRGGNHLDCFAFRDKDGRISGPLYNLYHRAGFKIDTSMNSGNPGEPYAIIGGVSSFVNAAGEVEPENPQVVIFMKR